MLVFNRDKITSRNIVTRLTKHYAPVSGISSVAKWSASVWD